MCDDHTLADAEAQLAASTPLNRRRFGGMTAVLTMTALLPRSAHALAVDERDVVIATPDGKADAYFVAPGSGKHPGVIIWPDILGLRPAFRLMGRRLAESGYAVLVVNPYYRSAQAPVVEPGASFRDEATRALVLPLARSLSATTNTTDAHAFVEFLDAQASVDTACRIGTMGYCMGGPMTFRTAAAEPGRVGAVASFHGGRLVTPTPDSPHLLVPKMRAQFLIAVAENDDEREPETKDTLRAAFEAAGLAAEVEVYEGALHGWCPPDSAVYNEAQAERAWARLLSLFERSLLPQTAAS